MSGARKKPLARTASRAVTRVQTGLRIEKRILLVLKATAGALDLSLGDLVEGMALHAFEGRVPFGARTLEQIAALKKVYGLELRAVDSHLLIERKPPKAG